VTAVLANHPRAQPPHQLGLRHHDVHDDQRVAAVHDAVERGGLRRCPREAIENEAAQRVASFKPLAHDADHHLVADQLAAVHDRFRSQTDLRPVMDGHPEHVAGRDLRDPAAHRKPFRLRTFPGPRWAQHDQV